MGSGSPLSPGEGATVRPMADSFSLPAGREADVSRQPDGRLLRRYRDARDTRSLELCLRLSQGPCLLTSTTACTRWHRATAARPSSIWTCIRRNVLLGPTGPVLMDWPNAQEGRPSLDVAMTAVILAQVSVGDLIGVDLDLSVMLAALLTGRADDPRCSLDAALKLRSKNPTMRPQELARLDDARALIEDMAG